MTDKQKMIKARDEYIELVKKELMGPGSEISIPDEEHELISDAGSESVVKVSSSGTDTAKTVH